MGDEFNADNLKQFLEAFEAAAKKMRAMECFAQIMEYVTGDGFDEDNPDALEGLAEILMNYGDREVMHHISKGV